jgi:hypothetical protein
VAQKDHDQTMIHRHDPQVDRQKRHPHCRCHRRDGVDRELSCMCYITLVLSRVLQDSEDCRLQQQQSQQHYMADRAQLDRERLE